MVAVLAAIAGAYFVIVAWRAGALARVLLPRGYAARGYDEPGLTLRLRILGCVGAALSVAGVGVAVARIVG
jgi:hypothetical protein